jgi:hypothetical protein
VAAASFAGRRRVTAISIWRSSMTRMKYIEIEGKRYLWREVLQLRRDQKNAYARRAAADAFRAQG